MVTSDSLPLVTAVVTTYQRFDDAKRAIQSVVAQSYQPLEILVVEDGTDSGIQAWLDSQQFAQVRYIRHADNRGLAAARNTGWRAARGVYVAYLDDDDLWKPQRIERQMALICGLPEPERQRVAVVTCGTEMHFPHNGRVSVRMPRNDGNLRRAIMRTGPSTPSSSFLFRRDALERVEGFDEALSSSIDHDIWMTLAVADYETRFVPEALVVHFDRFGRDTAMGATSRRIRGVQQYVEKWRPTYRDWFGDRVAATYARDYFIKVLGALAGGKLVQGRLKDTWSTYRALSTLSGQPIRSATAIVHSSMYLAMQRHLPPRVIAAAKSISHAHRAV